jgi:hypothetical protein
VSALREMNETDSITEAPHDCDNSGSIWETGKKLFQYVKYLNIRYCILLVLYRYSIKMLK